MSSVDWKLSPHLSSRILMTKGDHSPGNTLPYTSRKKRFLYIFVTPHRETDKTDRDRQRAEIYSALTLIGQILGEGPVEGAGVGGWSAQGEVGIDWAGRTDSLDIRSESKNTWGAGEWASRGRHIK